MDICRDASLEDALRSQGQTANGIDERADNPAMKSTKSIGLLFLYLHCCSGQGSQRAARDALDFHIHVASIKPGVHRTMESYMKRVKASMLNRCSTTNTHCVLGNGIVTLIMQYGARQQHSFRDGTDT